jgi:diadenosine tetraphosphatase ApaH/serine/threonine PP2A family protein phosphatase
MRYAIFSDIHANLEALEAVLAKIDELKQEEPIEQIWFLGDLVGYGPDPNECILKLRERTDVIIAGNHDWAAVGKIDLEDFSAAARISAEWTAEKLTEEHRIFLTNLPERLEIGECTLVHGSPYGPLWEYLTSEVLAERSFQYFSSRFCLVGHTHVPVIFQQPDVFSNVPTLPLQSDEKTHVVQRTNGNEHHIDDNDETEEMRTVQAPMQQATLSATVAGSAVKAFREPENVDQIEVEESSIIVDETKKMLSSDEQLHDAVDVIKVEEQPEATTNGLVSSENKEITAEKDSELLTKETTMTEVPSASPAAPEKSDLVEDSQSEYATTDAPANGSQSESEEDVVVEVENSKTKTTPQDDDTLDEDTNEQMMTASKKDFYQDGVDPNVIEEAGSENTIQSVDPEQDTIEISLEPAVVDSDDQLNGEIEELLTLLGLSQSMIQVTNEMIDPPEGQWIAEDGYRAIINPGGVGQPRDGDPRAAFMIYDTERGFEFYRVPYEYEKTQEKIIVAGLPQYLAIRLGYGR